MSGCRLQARLHFSLVFVAALGFTDAVLSLPVQDLLELLLLPANTNTETNFTSETFHTYVTARKDQHCAINNDHQQDVTVTDSWFLQLYEVNLLHSLLTRLPELLQLSCLAFMRCLL